MIQILDCHESEDDNAGAADNAVDDGSDEERDDATVPVLDWSKMPRGRSHRVRGGIARARRACRKTMSEQARLLHQAITE
ncbi:MAG: hypothetical protein ACE5LF_05185 [Alphaproteobacteria bacterium]